MTIRVRASLSLAVGISCLWGCSPDRHNRGAKAEIIASHNDFASFSSEALREAATRYPVVEDAHPETPISLTADDGTGLLLESLHAKAVVEGPLAFTELRMRFRNPLSRELEGRFQITLPEGASISRLAMRLPTGWQEAEVVERMAARRAYEDFLHRKQDPMLLEKEAGNQFSARIFPVAANGDKEVIVSYSHELSAAQGYRLPLRGLPMVGELSVRALVAERGASGAIEYQPHQMQVKGSVPTRDFRVGLQPLRALRHEGLVVARIQPTMDLEPSRLEGLTILFDTSASRAPGYARAVKRLGVLVEAIAAAQGASLRLRVAAFDQTTERIFDGVAGDFDKEHLAALLARRPLGASDLGAALQWAGRHDKPGRVLVISDLVATAGSVELAPLAKALPATVSRIDALLVGGVRDSEAAAQLVRGTRLHDGVILRETMSNAEIIDRIGAATTTLKVRVAGAKWTWPSSVEGMQPGDELIVYAEFPVGTSAPKHLQLEIEGGRSLQLESATTVGPLLTRSIARAQIARLQAQFMEQSDADKKQGHKQEIVDLSIKHRVLSEHTALLVLESEADYRRFGIDRRSLVNILVINDQGLSPEPTKREFAKGRAVEADPREAPTKADEADEADEAGGVGTRMAQADESNASGGLGTRMAQAEGRMGRRESTRATGQFAMRNNVQDPRLRRAIAREVNDSVRFNHSNANSAGSADFSAGLDDSDIYGGLLGNEAGGSGSGSGSSHGYGSGSGSRRSQQRIADQKGPPALTGTMAEIHDAIEAGRTEEAMTRAIKWRTEESGSVMALIALGEALEASNKPRLAARAYGSIIDLFPARADLRRFASARLVNLKGEGTALGVDSLKKAVAQRPDHLSVHRLLAYALVRSGDLAGAFDALEAGIARPYPQGRFAGGKRILQEDLGIVAMAWLAKEPAVKASIVQRLKKSGSTLAMERSIRFVLNWETDANDVDFHIYDSKGGHAFFGDRRLPSGGELYADVTTGYGPECFAINGKALAYPYELQVHYYSRGPMGYGMGQVEILVHDGKGGLTFDTRPFVVMNDGAYLALGSIDSASL